MVLTNLNFIPVKVKLLAPNLRPISAIPLIHPFGLFQDVFSKSLHMLVELSFVHSLKSSRHTVVKKVKSVKRYAFPYSWMKFSILLSKNSGFLSDWTMSPIPSVPLELLAPLPTT